MNTLTHYRKYPMYFCIAMASVSVVHAAIPSPAPSWLQWGGPTRDFILNDNHLAKSWPAEGPKSLWKRKLGVGFSSIVSDGKTLFTMYRKECDEIVTAIRADNGETIWEYQYHAQPYDDQNNDFGQGPNASPLIDRGRVFTVGFTGVMKSLDAKTGKVLWSHDLVKEFGGDIQYYGYATSPLMYDGNVIVPVGGEKFGIVALHPETGSPVWHSKPYEISYAAPILINVDGQDQYVFFSPDKVIGINPKNGSFLWSHPVVNFCKTNCTSAIWGEDHLLWVATKGVGGTRVLKLNQQEGKTKVEEVWLNRKIRVYQWNAIRVGDYVYTSTGDSQQFIVIVDVKTGEIVKKMRGFGATNGIFADGKLILLDDNGMLVLAEITPGDLNIVSKTQLLDSVTWTPPTLVDSTLYVRDREYILAIDLG